MKKEVELTPSQRRAALETLDKSVCVNANAGSGKTTILIERILAFLEQAEENINRILAITFTDKAAQAMREKLIEKMREKGKAYWLVETAYISTIHGFCSRLLKENCFVAGVSPDFRVLGDTEAELLLEDAIKAAIESLLASDDLGILELLGRYSSENLIENTSKIINHLRAGGLTDLPEKISLELLTKTIAEKKKDIFSLCQNIIYPLQNVCYKKEKLENFRKALLSSKNLAELTEVVSKMKFTGQGNKLYYIELARAKEKLENILELVAALETAIDYDTEITLNNAFLKLLSIAQKNYAAAKQSQNGLDYEDLQLKTLELLQKNETLRQKYQQLFIQIFVDEFQDTNLLQTKLIELLRKKNNLFLVGDWKQSIYLFRYADVEIFSQYIQNSNNNKESEVIPLVENFRSEKNILDFVNTTCYPVFGPQYEPLEFPKNKENHSSPAGKISVTFVECPAGKSELSRQVEGKFVLDKIKDLIQKGRKPGDIALLFRTYAPFELYENLLDNADIPFVSFGGKNYFKRPELVTILNYLKVLSNPKDELALGMVLRSSLGGICDETLLLLCQARKKLNISLHDYIKNQHYAELPLPSAEKMRLNLFQENLLTLRSYVGYLNIPELLSQVFIKTGYQDIVLAETNPTRALANLLKLQEIAKEFADRTDVTLDQFIRYIDAMQLREAREEDAAIVETDANAVKLLTIHKAKGLEFPIVFLPSLFSSKNTRSENILLDPKLFAQGFPIGFRFADETKDEQEEDYYIYSSAYLLLAEKRARAEQAESGRLWYVALTRAREELHLFTLAPFRKDETRELPWPDIYQTSQNWALWLQRLENDKALASAEVNWIPWDKQNIPKIWKHKKEKEEWKIPKDIRPEIFQLKQKTKTFQHLAASQAALLAITPQEYFRKEYLGLSPLNLEESQQLGKLVHELIEKGERNYETVIANSNLSSKSKTLAQKCLTNYFNSEIYKKISSGIEHYFELDFELKEKETYLSGRMDLIYLENGIWHVVDFKTNLKTIENLQKYQEQLRIYARALMAKGIPAKNICLEVFYLLENITEKINT